MPTLSTPPHEPLYNVHASEDDIRRVIERVMPGTSLLSSKELPRGSSFNNRIYTIRVGKQGTTSGSSDDSTERELIFKVSGNSWEKLKTLNEVMCLRLVERHCPGLPVPRVIAWSNDRAAPEGGRNEWILMDRMPGEVATSLVLTEDERKLLLEDYAKILVALRTKIPSPGRIGTVIDVTEDGYAILGNTALNTDATGAPWRTCPEYFKALLQSELNLLENNIVYESNRHLVPLVKKFISSSLLGELPIFQNPYASAIVFTHNDPADRNILVTRSSVPGTAPVQITGFIDFEFAGFFPALDDFVNMSDEYLFGVMPDQSNHNDALDVLCSHMESLGVATPIGSVLQPHWQTVLLLRQVLDNTAPWYVRNKEPGDEVKSQLEEPARLLLEAIQKLAQLGSA